MTHREWTLSMMTSTQSMEQIHWPSVQVEVSSTYHYKPCRSWYAWVHTPRRISSRCMLLQKKRHLKNQGSLCWKRLMGTLRRDPILNCHDFLKHFSNRNDWSKEPRCRRQSVRLNWWNERRHTSEHSMRGVTRYRWPQWSGTWWARNCAEKTPLRNWKLKGDPSESVETRRQTRPLYIRSLSPEVHFKGRQHF